MNYGPSITSEYKTRYLGVEISLNFPTNLTFINGYSGTGKTFLFNVLSNEALMDERLLCFDAKHPPVLDDVKGRLIIIDNADLVLNEELRRKIAFDCDNQYVIMGRNPELLMLTEENISELSFDGKCLFNKNIA